VFFALSVPADFFDSSPIGTGRTSAGVTPTRGSLSGRDAGLGLVDDDRATPDGELGAEFEEVLPVEGDGDVERGRSTCRWGFVETRTRHDDSPPRICEPKLFVMIAW
jgi:hypothetical protein